nr:unnamed protein product [Callosobruchus chinensis]
MVECSIIWKSGDSTFSFLMSSRTRRKQNNSWTEKIFQSAYFSQQYNLYNFTVVNGSSKNKLGKDHVWTDLDLAKNSSVISSALFDALSKFKFSGAIEEVSIFADGCPTQNKNTTVNGMLCYWLKEKTSLNIKKNPGWCKSFCAAESTQPDQGTGNGCSSLTSNINFVIQILHSPTTKAGNGCEDNDINFDVIPGDIRYTGKS